MVKKIVRRLYEMQRVLFLLLLAFLTFSYAMFQGGFVSWFLFYSFLPFALYALCLAFYSLSDFGAERTFIQREFSAGDKATVDLLIKRRKQFPLLYLVIEERIDEASSMKGHFTSSKKIFFPRFQKEIHFEYSIERLLRGEHLFKGVRVKTGDFFGLIEKEFFIPIQNSILVYPAYKELSYKPMESQFDQGAASSNERIQRDSSMTVGVREYQPGDRFSWINWKASARRNEFMTKEFEQRKSHDVMIVMDCAPTPLFEEVVSFAASISRAVLKKGAEVGLITSNGERTIIPIQGGDSQQQQLFYHLAKIKASSLLSFDKVLDGEAFLGRQYNRLIFVTALFTQELVDKAGFFLKGNGTVSIFLLKGKLETLSKAEQRLMASARLRGVHIKVVCEGDFSEVKES